MSLHNRPWELLPRAESLANILVRHPYVSGVALTGSLARRSENCVHDIDLVVFSVVKPGLSRDPQVREFSYSNEFSLSDVVGKDIAEHLSRARRDIPVNYIWTDPRALWDCDVLQSLERSENFPGFYLTIFRQIPLVLIDHTVCRGTLRRYLDHLLDSPSLDLKSPLFLGGMRLQHVCDNPGCRPEKLWEERRREIKARKGPCPHEVPGPNPFMKDTG